LMSLTLALGLCGVQGCASKASCVPNGQQACRCPGGRTGFQTCLPSGSEFSGCSCSQVTDGATETAPSDAAPEAGSGADAAATTPPSCCFVYPDPANCTFCDCFYQESGKTCAETVANTTAAGGTQVDSCSAILGCCGSRASSPSGGAFCECLNSISLSSCYSAGCSDVILLSLGFDTVTSNCPQ
jgi:hypothetical protein